MFQASFSVPGAAYAFQYYDLDSPDEQDITEQIESDTGLKVLEVWDIKPQ